MIRAPLLAVILATLVVLATSPGRRWSPPRFEVADRPWDEPADPRPYRGELPPIDELEAFSFFEEEISADGFTHTVHIYELSSYRSDRHARRAFLSHHFRSRIEGSPGHPSEDHFWSRSLEVPLGAFDELRAGFRYPVARPGYLGSGIVPWGASDELRVLHFDEEITELVWHAHDFDPADWARWRGTVTTLITKHHLDEAPTERTLHLDLEDLNDSLDFATDLAAPSAHWWNYLQIKELRPVGNAPRGTLDLVVGYPWDPNDRHPFRVQSAEDLDDPAKYIGARVFWAESNPSDEREAVPSDPAVTTTVAALLADPRAFDRRRVRVAGYYNADRYWRETDPHPPGFSDEEGRVLSLWRIETQWPRDVFWRASGPYVVEGLFLNDRSSRSLEGPSYSGVLDRITQIRRTEDRIPSLVGCLGGAALAWIVVVAAGLAPRRQP